VAKIDFSIKWTCHFLPEWENFWAEMPLCYDITLPCLCKRYNTGFVEQFINFRDNWCFRLTSFLRSRNLYILKEILLLFQSFEHFGHRKAIKIQIVVSINANVYKVIYKPMIQYMQPESQKGVTNFEKHVLLLFE